MEGKKGKERNWKEGMEMTRRKCRVVKIGDIPSI